MDDDHNLSMFANIRDFYRKGLFCDTRLLVKSPATSTSVDCPVTECSEAERGINDAVTRASSAVATAEAFGAEERLHPTSVSPMAIPTTAGMTTTIIRCHAVVLCSAIPGLKPYL